MFKIEYFIPVYVALVSRVKNKSLHLVERGEHLHIASLYYISFNATSIYEIKNVFFIYVSSLACFPFYLTTHSTRIIEI